MLLPRHPRGWVHHQEGRCLATSTVLGAVAIRRSGPGKLKKGDDDREDQNLNVSDLLGGSKARSQGPRTIKEASGMPTVLGLGDFEMWSFESGSVCNMAELNQIDAKMPQVHDELQVGPASLGQRGRKGAYPRSWNHESSIDSNQLPPQPTPWGNPPLHRLPRGQNVLRLFHTRRSVLTTRSRSGFNTTGSTRQMREPRRRGRDEEQCPRDTSKSSSAFSRTGLTS